MMWNEKKKIFIIKKLNLYINIGTNKIEIFKVGRGRQGQVNLHLQTWKPALQTPDHQNLNHNQSLWFQ